MKLFTGNLSPYSAKVRMQIYAMGIEDVEFELPVAFYMGKLNDLSPIGRIPVMEVAEGIIPESEVIAEYLDDLYPDKAMLGSSAFERSQVRLLSRIGDIYLMNNIFMALPQIPRQTRVDEVRDLLIGQVTRGMGALEQHLGDRQFAVGDFLSRADCSLVPALFLCEKTVPRLDVDNPINTTTKVAAYWQRIQQNEHASRILEEMNQGLQERLDGTEKRRVEAAIAEAKQKGL
jgi:glutathione S-transferase